MGSGIIFWDGQIYDFDGRNQGSASLKWTPGILMEIFKKG